MSIAALAGLGLSFAACSTPHRSLADSGFCAGLVEPGSSLAKDLFDPKMLTQCKTPLPEDHRAWLLLEAGGELDPGRSKAYRGDDFAPQLILSASRLDKPGGKPISLDFVAEVTGGTVTDLNTKVPVQLGATKVAATAFRLDDDTSKIGYACLLATTTGALGQPTEVYICRSVSRYPANADVLRVARDYVAKDFASINP